MIVGLDPGHGGSNLGTHHYGIEEEHFVLDLCLAARQLITALGMGVELSRTVNETVTFEARAERLRAADVVFSVHVNAYTSAEPRELRAYIDAAKHPVAVAAAMALERLAPPLVAPAKPSPTLVGPNGDEQRAYNTIAKHHPRPAVLAEMFYCTSEPAARWAQTPYGRAALANTLAGAAVAAWEALSTGVGGSGPETARPPVSPIGLVASK